MGCEMKGYKRLTDRILAEMLINTEGESWDSDNIEAQCYIRLAELEDKIERGELISIVQDEQSEQEIAFFVKHNAEVRKQAVREFLKLLKEKESPKLLMWEYGEGYLDCIKTAEEIAAQYGVEVEE